MSETQETPEAVAEFKELMADPAARQAFVTLKAEAAQGERARRYSHILQLVSSTPWAVRDRAVLNVIVDLLAFRANGGRYSADEIEARVAPHRRPAPAAGSGGVAVIPLRGVIMPRAGAFDDVSGGSSMEAFRASFRDALAAEEVGSIVIDVDSPGGMVDQVPEMAAEIRSARGIKPIVAVANTEAASAAYWLASQADEFVASPSARVGSIGVFTTHEDRSAEAEAAGVRTTVISAGKYKTEGNPFEPLTPEARGAMERLVESYYSMFVGDVAAARGVSVDAVRAGYGEGRMENAADALRLGMIDRVATAEQVIGGLLAASPDRARPAAMGYSVTGDGLVVGGVFGHNGNASAPDPEPVPDPAALTVATEPKALHAEASQESPTDADRAAAAEKATDPTAADEILRIDTQIANLRG